MNVSGIFPPARTTPYSRGRASVLVEHFRPISARYNKTGSAGFIRSRLYGSPVSFAAC